MKKGKKVIIISLFGVSFFTSLIINMPTWIVSWTLYLNSNHRMDLSNERGTFWNGSAMLLAQDNKTTVPLLLVGWKIKLGFKKFIDINFNSAGKPIAEVSYGKEGLQVSNVNLILPLSSLTPFLGNINTLGLSGNVRATADLIKVAKKMQGNVKVQLEDVGSSISPVNPIGTYNLSMDLASTALSVNSEGSSVISVSGDGNLNALTIKATVQPDKKEKLTQFLTMMGIPQADGSYQMKVF